MEKCKQCGEQARIHPIIAMMSIQDAGQDGLLGVAFGDKFGAYPLCEPCHKAPRLKAHFHIRRDLNLALRLVDMTSIQMPR